MKDYTRRVITIWVEMWYAICEPATTLAGLRFFMAKLTKQDIGFTQVKNEVLADSSLSYKAKGLFAYLFSKPDRWDFSADRIYKESSDGRKSVLAGLKELEKAGYLERKRLGTGRVEYYLAYSKDPKCPNGTVPKGHCAQTALISNTDAESNKELKVTPFDASVEIHEGRKDQGIIDIINAFKPVNPAHGRWYSIPVQRAACTRLIQTHGLPAVLRAIAILPQSNTIPYLPVITTPMQLEDKWAALVAGMRKHKQKDDDEKPPEPFDVKKFIKEKNGKGIL